MDEIPDRPTASREVMPRFNPSPVTNRPARERCFAIITINDKEVKLEKFPDGTWNLRLDLNLLLDCADIGAVIRWNYHDESELSALIMITETLKAKSIHPLQLQMPYVPNARMDRVKHMNEVFTLKYFADVINFLEFDNVVMFDPHSDVAPAVIQRSYPDDAAPYIEQAISDIASDLILFYPDEGAMKRYSGRLKFPAAFGIKNRNWDTGEITSLTLHGESPKGRDVLMVDDICSSGGTLYHSAKLLRELGANRIFAYTSHCIPSAKDSALVNEEGLIQRLYTTDSVFDGHHDKITVFNWR